MIFYHNVEFFCCIHLLVCFHQIQQNIEFRVSGPEGQCSRKFEKFLYFNNKMTIVAMLLEDGIHIIVYLKNCTIFEEVSATKNLMRMPILKRNFLGFFYCISQKVN